MAVVATGFFDGVHPGHRLVIETLLSEARGRGEEAIVVTFWPHPRAVLQNGADSLRYLSSRYDREFMLRSLGVDAVETVPFTRDFASRSAADYLDMLRRDYACSALVLGYDTRFGCEQAGPSEIAAIAADKGMGVRIVPPVTLGGSSPAVPGGSPAAIPGVGSAVIPGGSSAAVLGGSSAAVPDGSSTAVPGGSEESPAPVSSTRIRAALSEGDVSRAALLLGRPYRLEGVVVSGDRIGRTLGFPTANMRLYEPLMMLPRSGVYKTLVRVAGAASPDKLSTTGLVGMTNIGVRPTVGGGNALTIETHILDFDEMIYGLDISLDFLARIRDERRFSSLEALKTQLRADAGQVRKV